MQPQELFEKAKARCEALLAQGPPDARGRERLREDAAGFFRRVPEPPVYLRPGESGRAAAPGLWQEGVELLGRAWALLKSGGEPADTSLTQALERHLEALSQVGEGHLREAELAWSRALQHERDFRAAVRSWRRPADQSPPVFDRAQGVSRYDPQEAPRIEVRLACPYAGCQSAQSLAFSPEVSRQRFVCEACHRAFLAFFGEVLEQKVTPSARGNGYELRLRELGGAQARVQFDDASGQALQLSAGDLVGLLYSENRELLCVVNLDTSRTLTVRSPHACFVAGAVFGPQAPQLATFRNFRDRALVPRPLGRRAVAYYYAHAEAWADAVARRPRLRQGLRTALSVFERALVRLGFGRPT